MTRYQVLTLSFFLLQTLSASFCEQHNNLEDVNEIANELKEKFGYVKHSENFTAYLLNDNNLLSYAVKEHPPRWDWRHEGKVSPIKNQKECGACWAFSAVACIESQLSIWRGKNFTLSEQFLIDCVNDGKDDAPKCKNENYNLAKAYWAIYNFGGVMNEIDYRPYSGEAGECPYKNAPPNPVPVTGFNRVKNDEDVMADYLYHIGPLSAGINSTSMRKYENYGFHIDIPTEEQCSSRPEKMDHSVLIVGYDEYDDPNTKISIPYWIIKNSWGETFGDQGYYYLVRGRNACGIANDVTYALVPNV